MTTPQIQSLVCAHFGVTLADMLSHRRTEGLAWARHVAIWLCCEVSQRRYGTLSAISKPFNRTEPSIHYSVASVDEAISVYPAKAAEVSKLLYEVVEGRKAA